jgi:hypothetical protein
VVIEGGTYVGRPGSGHFLRRGLNGYLR